MKELFVALPTGNLEAMLLRRNDADSHELLTSWTCVYHPQVLRRTRSLARPFFAENTYEELSDTVLIVPYSAYSMLDEYWIDRAKDRGCVFLTRCADMEALIADVCQALDESPKNESPQNETSQDETSQDETSQDETSQDETSPKPCDTPDAVGSGECRVDIEDFLAVGMMHFLTELLSRRMNYSSTLDDYSLRTSLLATLDAFLAGDAAQACNDLCIVWDQIIQSRQYYAHSDGYFFEMVLLAESVLGDARVASLRQRLQAPDAVNLLAEGIVIRRIAEKHPELLAEMKQALASGRMTLLGGEEIETQLPMLTQEGVLRRLTHGLEVYQKWFGQRPKIFARRRFGLTPMLPDILEGLGYEAAVHTALDAGTFPVPGQTRTLWRGCGNTELEAFAGVPADAKNCGEILALPEIVGNSLNTDNTRGLIFAHWPGESETSLWFRLWKRSARHVPVFGELATFATCLENTSYSSMSETFSPDAYVTPYLAQDVTACLPDPISRWTRYHQTRAELETLVALEGLREWMTEKRPAETHRVQALLDELDREADCSRAWHEATGAKMNIFRKRYVSDIAKCLSGKKPKRKSGKNAVLVINPLSFSRKETVNLSAAETELASIYRGDPSHIRPETGVGGVLSHAWLRSRESKTEKITHAVRVEVPGCGFSVVADSPQGPAHPTENKKRAWPMSLFFRRKKVLPPVYRDDRSNTWIMRNEHLELRFDPYTGHLRAVYDNHHRGNRLSQQVGMRLKPAPMGDLFDESGDHYTILAADEFHSGCDASQSWLRVEGRLMDRTGEIAARITQVTTLRMGESMIEFDVTLEPVLMPQKNPWQSYYANRFVWADTDADIFRGVGMQSVVTSAERIESPLFVEVRPVHLGLSTAAVNKVTQAVSQALRKDGRAQTGAAPRDSDTEYRESRRITVLPGGLPYHRRVGSRQLDTLLIVHGETQRRFRFGVCLDATYPAGIAAGFMTTPVQMPIRWNADVQSLQTGWMLHVDRRNVMITHWEPTKQGAMMRLMETRGRRSLARVRACRDIRAANQTDFFGNVRQSLRVENAAAVVEIPPNGWVQVVVEFGEQ